MDDFCRSDTMRTDEDFVSDFVLLMVVIDWIVVAV